MKRLLLLAVLLTLLQPAEAGLKHRLKVITRRIVMAPVELMADVGWGIALTSAYVRYNMHEVRWLWEEDYARHSKSDDTTDGDDK